MPRSTSAGSATAHEHASFTPVTQHDLHRRMFKKTQKNLFVLRILFELGHSLIAIKIRYGKLTITLLAKKCR
jgi:hypothetical protein